MLSVIGFVVVRCGLPLVGGAPYPDTVVRVAANDDGVVPGCPGGGVAVGVVADDDVVVPGRPSRGVTVGVAADDDVVVPGCPGGGAAFAYMELDTAGDSAFEDPAKW